MCVKIHRKFSEGGYTICHFREFIFFKMKVKLCPNSLCTVNLRQSIKDGFEKKKQ